MLACLFAVPAAAQEPRLEWDAAGRSAIADQVRDARSRGIDASAWLPSTHDTDALAQYAIDHGASVLVLPADLDGLDDVRSKAAALGIRPEVVGATSSDAP